MPDTSQPADAIVAPSPHVYWAQAMKHIQATGGFQTLQNLQQLKRPAPDGKMRATGCADRERLQPSLFPMDAGD